MEAFEPRAPLHKGSIFPKAIWLEGWTRWDGQWYHAIATIGYSYTKGSESAAAFFPAYPLVMRIGSAAFGEPWLIGMAFTFVCGLVGVTMFHRWTHERLSSASARMATLTLILAPTALFLYAAVYAEALFLLSAIAAFWALDSDRPGLAGLAGAVGTASRAYGVAIVIGLMIRAVERRGGIRQLSASGVLLLFMAAAFALRNFVA